MMASRIRYVATLAAMLAAASGRAQAPGVQSGTITLPETRIYYEVAGSGPVVVFIHAFALNLREWDDQVKVFAPQYRIIAYDRRGFGKSTGIANQGADAEDLRELLDTLGVRSAVLVGHNGGPAVGARFVRVFPERVNGLVFYPSPPIPGFPYPPEPDPMGDRGAFVRTYGLDSFFKYMHTLPQFYLPPNRPDIKERIESMLATYSGQDILAGAGRPATPGPYRLPNFEELKALTVPTLFITGDRAGPHALMVADSMARWMSNARNVVIPGGGVYVHLNEPDRFNAALLAFLRSLPSGNRR
jgi:3-oxoadipate enol-lactonase